MEVAAVIQTEELVAAASAADDGDVGIRQLRGGHIAQIDGGKLRLRAAFAVLKQIEQFVGVAGGNGVVAVQISGRRVECADVFAGNLAKDRIGIVSVGIAVHINVGIDPGVQRDLRLDGSVHGRGVDDGDLALTVHRSILIGGRADRAGTDAHSSHVTVLIDGRDTLVRGGPGHGLVERGDGQDLDRKIDVRNARRGDQCHSSRRHGHFLNSVGIVFDLDLGFFVNVCICRRSPCLPL